MPVEYKTISIARCNKLAAASMIRAISSTLRISRQWVTRHLLWPPT